MPASGMGGGREGTVHGAVKTEFSIIPGRRDLNLVGSVKCCGCVLCYTKIIIKF